MRILVKNINSVSQLKEGIDKIPDNATIQPFGANNACLLYDDETNTAYIDENIDELMQE
ncbi:MAG: hypothetical protein K6D02_01790 [Lachnospiraceae bacterium]|nr:hypothetical protein [Lachnospiraceae bacterium]